MSAFETSQVTSGIDYEYRGTDRAGSHEYLFPIVSNSLKTLPAGARVLDLGCGNGTFISSFRGRGWDLYGADFSSSGVEIARKSFPEVSFVLADATRQPISPFFTENAGSFDVIISTEVIEHVYDPRGLLKNARSLLKPGGMLILSTPYHGYLKNLLLALTGKLDQHFTVLWDHGHIKFWSRKTLTSALTEAGFEQICFFGAGRLPWMWKSMVISSKRPAEGLPLDPDGSDRR